MTTETAHVGGEQGKCEPSPMVRALSALMAYEAALRDIASFSDKGGNEQLAATGSYSKFDEPWSVERARKVLAEVEKANP